MFVLQWLIETPILHGYHVMVPKTLEVNYVFFVWFFLFGGGSLRQISNVFMQTIFVVVSGYCIRSCSSTNFSIAFNPYGSRNQMLIFKSRYGV